MATNTEIITEIEALETHCRAPILTPQQRATWMRDWCGDLSSFDVEVIRVGFREWRMSGQTRFPTPGQVMPMIRKAADRKAPAGDKPKPWQPLSDADYDALSIMDKIRHRMILASEARTKAGPMWKDNRPAELREMPEGWFNLRKQADGHMAEVKRLRETIH